MNKSVVDIVGGGLAGCEAAYQLLKNGYGVRIFEMRPTNQTPAHKSGNLAELVCSNSLKSQDQGTASGLLKAELEALDSLLLDCAKVCSVPGGSALTVNRELFSKEVENRLNYFENFERIDKEVVELPSQNPTIIAAGPLCSDALASEIATLCGSEALHFYDAVAPIIAADSIDMQKAYFASRYGKGNAEDYLNCGFSKEQYDAFYDALVNAETVALKHFENIDVFEGCMPIEVMAKRGKDTLRYGPMRPVGLKCDGKSTYAVVQLRRENTEGTMYNLVGFQTNLTFGEQRKVFRMIPSLENAEFLRYGVMHRNTYLDSPKLIDSGFRCKKRDGLWFAGQITGVEGYVESIASGLMAALNLMAYLEGTELPPPPKTTLCGALAAHMESVNNFEPMNANFGILPPIENIKNKQERKLAYFTRGITDIAKYKENFLKWK